MGNDGVAAVEKALQLLDCFSPGTERLTLTALAKLSGMHKTTVYRLMNSLERMNYAVRAQDGSYSLGHRVLYLGKLFEQSFQLGAVVEPALRALAEATGESASYYIHDNGRRLCLFRAEPRAGLRDTRLAGTTLPLDDTATSRVIRYWGLGEPVYQQPPALPLFAAGVRDPHVGGFAAPLFGVGNKFLAALSLTGPASRLVPAHASGALAAPLLAAASDLSRRLGAGADFCTHLYRPASR